MPDPDRFQATGQLPGASRGTQPLGRPGTRPLGTSELPAVELESLLASAGAALARLAPVVARLIAACRAADLPLPGVEAEASADVPEAEVGELAAALRAAPDVAKQVQVAVFRVQEAEKARAQTAATGQRAWAEALKRQLYLLDRMPEELAAAPAIASLFGQGPPVQAPPLDTHDRVRQKAARQAVLVRAQALASRLEAPLTLLARAIAPAGTGELGIGGWLAADAREARIWGFKLAKEEQLKAQIFEARARHAALVAHLPAAWAGEPIAPVEEALAAMEASIQALQGHPLVRELFPPAQA